MTRISTPYPADTENPADLVKIWFALFQCDACRYASMASMRTSVETARELSRRMAAPVKYDSVDSHPIDYEYVGACFDQEYTKLEWYPVRPLGRRFEDVPQHIADAASEAYACFSIRSYRAAILMARSVIEATAKNKNVTNGGLASKIDELADKGIISPQIKAEAHEIRHLGNDMAHGDFIEPVDEGDADDVLGFLATFLNYVYQIPAAIRRRQEARYSRNSNPNA